MKKTTKSSIECQKSDVPQIDSSMQSFQYLNLYSYLVSHEALIILQRSTKWTYPRKSLPVYLKQVSYVCIKIF